MKHNSFDNFQVCLPPYLTGIWLTLGSGPENWVTMPRVISTKLVTIITNLRSPFIWLIRLFFAFQRYKFLRVLNLSFLVAFIIFPRMKAYPLLGRNPREPKGFAWLTVRSAKVRNNIHFFPDFNLTLDYLLIDF